MKNLTEGNIYKTFIVFAIPMVLAGVLSNAYGMVDTVIAGKLLGESALGAVGATSALISFISSVFWGYDCGFAIYIARLFGAGEYARIKRGVRVHLLITSLVAILVSLLMILFRNPILDWLKVDPAIREQTATYFVLYILGMVFYSANYNSLYVLNAFGIGTFPFIISLVSAFLNICGNLFTVAVLKLGVAGLAVSSVFAAGVCSLLYLAELRRNFQKMPSANLSFGLSEVKESVSYAGPVLFQQLVMYLVGFLLSPMVNHIGAAASAAYNVVNKVYDVNAGIYQNAGKTLGNFTSQCVGAGKTNLLRKGFLVALLQNLVFLAIPLSACVFFAEPVNSLFFEAGERGESFAMAIEFSRFFLPFILLNMVNNLFHHFYRGQKKMKLLILSTCVGSIARLGFGWVLTRRMGMTGFYIGWVISWATEAVLGVSVFLFSRNKSNRESQTAA